MSETKTSRADRYFYRNLKQILEYGYGDDSQSVRPHWADGTPAHTKYILNVQETYDLSRELPITSLRPIACKMAFGEILWIYRDASNDLNVLRDKYGVTWWDSWDIGDRTIGSCYGHTVRKYNLFENLIRELKTNPFSRRHIMSLWQNDELQEQHGLDPCCFMTTWSVTGDKGIYRLHLKLEQRSSDYIVAGHINKMQYAALQMLVAREVGMEVGTFTHSVTNLHIYDRHEDAARELIRRFEEELPKIELPNPTLKLKEGTTLQDIMPGDFILEDYKPLEKLPRLELAI